MAAVDKPLLFVIGTPRSGTSLLTKALDAHPGVAVLMGNIFGNRRRHNRRDACWDSEPELGRRVAEAYDRLTEPVVGNKVITPDVWDELDIVRFCRLFRRFHIVYIVRDPAAVAASRLRREPENFDQVFSPAARAILPLDFRSRLHAYASSWRLSVETCRRLRGDFPGQVCLVHYEDLCTRFQDEMHRILDFAGLRWNDLISAWHTLPHHDAQGALVRDLKYPDRPAAPPDAESSTPSGWTEASAALGPVYSLWKERRL